MKLLADLPSTGEQLPVANDIPWLLDSEAENKTKYRILSLLCSIYQKTQSRPKRYALGNAIWIDTPCKTLTRQSLLEHVRSSCHESAVSKEATHALPSNDDRIRHICTEKRVHWAS